MASERRQSGLWNRNAETGLFEQVPLPQAQIRPKGPYQYYEPPKRAAYEPPRRSFSDRTGNPDTNNPQLLATNHLARPGTQSQRNVSDGAAPKINEPGQNMADPVKEALQSHPVSLSDHLAQTRHINEVDLPDASNADPTATVDLDEKPTNLRSKAWSPDPVSESQSQLPQTKASQGKSRQRQASSTSNVSDKLRRSSVPDRGPLQTLESWSKEEKRAKVERAEKTAREQNLTGNGDNTLSRTGILGSDKERAISDGATRRPSQRERKDERGQVSGPASPDTTNTARPFQSADNSFQNKTIEQHPSPPEQKDARHSANQSRAYRAVPEIVTGEEKIAEPQSKLVESAPKTSTDLGRSKSAKYRARDAGFSGAAAAYNAGPTVSGDDAAAQRGKVAYERRKASVNLSPGDSPISPVSPDSDRADGLGIGRSGSKRLHKRSPLSGDHGAKAHLQSDRISSSGSRHGRPGTRAYQEHDPVPAQQVQNPPEDPIRYAVPPQTAGGQHAREQVGFGHESGPAQATRQKGHHFRQFLHHTGHEHRTYQSSSEPLDDWRNSKTARLTYKDLDLDRAFASASKKDGEDDAWWEKSRRRSSGGSRKVAPTLAKHDEPYEEQANGFQPTLFLKSGPLLRYTGIRKEAATPSSAGVRSSTSVEKEVWRGSIMIVTEDEYSDLSSTPILRLFAQPMDLHQSSAQHSEETGQNPPLEDENTLAGQVKLSRTGRALCARPLHELKGGIDLSREETPKGLYAALHTPVVGSKVVSGSDARQGQKLPLQNKSRIKSRNGEGAGRFREVKAIRLLTERGCTFWRFSIEVELTNKQSRIAYRINNGPAIGFWVPARGEMMNIMFHSCNGFSHSVDPNVFSGPDPLWRDVLNRHQSRPFHVMIGGGDQIYNDAVSEETELFGDWIKTKNPELKHSADFTTEMQEELEQFYLNRYAMWFSQGLFGMANSQIPMVNIWDDHDIIDGYGSYPHTFMGTRVFTGLGAIAFKYYMLFQHQSVVAETEKEEPSWLLGAGRGPYINEFSRNLFMSLGDRVCFLGLDCRTERMKNEIISQETYDVVFDRCHAEINKGQTRHLIVLLGVPIAYPRLNFLENILTSRFLDPIKAIGRTGALGGFVNKFDGGVEILDDLDDHWTAKHHKDERNWFIQELQELAAEKSVRITILGGDVHLAAVGRFYSNKRLGIAKDRDHRYMPNIVSSAIVNTPPPTTMADVLNRRNKVHHLDQDTDEDMIPMFNYDVDGNKRNNKHLLPRRNFCIIREYLPGSTPPSTPVMERLEPDTSAFTALGADTQDDDKSKDRRFPPGPMKRTMSLTRGPINLVRRLSGSSKHRPTISTGPYPNYQQAQQPEMHRANSLSGANTNAGEKAERPTYTFHRRPTDLSVKDARKAAVAANNIDGREPGHIDLEGGLDISLCMENDQHDPAGTTTPYRLLIPALHYEGSEDLNNTKFKSHRKSLMARLKWNRSRETPVDGPYDDDAVWSGASDASRTPTPPPGDPAFEKQTQHNTAANALGLTSTGRGAMGQTRESYSSAAAGEVVGMKDATPRTNAYRSTSATQAPPQSAHTKGYNFSGPPIGALYSPPTGPSAENTNGHSSPHPQSGYRRTDESAGRNTTTSYHNDDQRSYTNSEQHSFDDDDDKPAGQPQARRGSKVERFFGIGDAGSGEGRASMQQERPSEGLSSLGRSGSKKVPAWKIWK